MPDQAANSLWQAAQLSFADCQALAEAKGRAGAWPATMRGVLRAGLGLRGPGANMWSVIGVQWRAERSQGRT